MEAEIADEPNTAASFEVAKSDLQFDCDLAVYQVGSGRSLCYVTSEDYGQFIVAALEHFKKSGEMKKYIEALKP